MQPNKWAEQLAERDFEILYKGHFGKFWFWHGTENISYFKRKLLWIIQRVVPRVRKMMKSDSAALSAYCGLVARKK
jgi:alpha-amylase/alpha-mannosidase (GH57 family)